MAYRQAAKSFSIKQNGNFLTQPAQQLPAQQLQQLQSGILKELHETVNDLKEAMNKGLQNLEIKLKDNNKDLQNQLIQTTDLLKQELVDISSKTKEIQENFTKMVAGLIDRVQVVEVELKNIKENDQKLERCMDKLQQENIALRHQIERNEQANEQANMVSQFREMEFAIRIHGMKEEKELNLQQACANLFADWTGIKEEHLLYSFEKVYRVNSRVAREKNLPRDIVVYFDKRSLRNKVIQSSFNRNFQSAGQDLIVMKEIPSKMLAQRKEYGFLTAELRRRYRYRWEIPTGLVVSYLGETYRLDTTEKAKDFYSKMVKDGHLDAAQKKVKSADQRGVALAPEEFSSLSDIGDLPKEREEDWQQQLRAKKSEEGFRNTVGREEFRKAFSELLENLKCQ